MRPPPALRNADFRSLWLAGLISDAGDWLLFIALPIVVYRETGSALGTSLAFLIELAPGIGFAAVVGRLADRWDRRRMLLAVSLLQALALLPLLFVHDRSQLPVVYAVIFGQATLAALFDPAKNALLPTLLPADELVSANALVALSQNFGRLLGGPLGGLLLVLGDLRLIAAADLISYLLAAALIARLRPRLRARSGSPGRRRRSPVPAAFLAGLRGRRVRASLLVAFIGQIAQGIFVVLFVLFVAQRLHGGSAEIGLLRRCAGDRGDRRRLDRERPGSRGFAGEAYRLVGDRVRHRRAGALELARREQRSGDLRGPVHRSGGARDPAGHRNRQRVTAEPATSTSGGPCSARSTWCSNAGQVIGILAAGLLTAHWA